MKILLGLILVMWVIVIRWFSQNSIAYEVWPVGKTTAQGWAWRSDCGDHGSSTFIYDYIDNSVVDPQQHEFLWQNVFDLRQWKDSLCI